MPIYGYKCHACGHHDDFLQKMSDEPLVNCPKCGKPAFNKLISMPAGFNLKGTGWYVTDFKNKSTTTSNESKAPECTQPPGSTGKGESCTS